MALEAFAIFANGAYFLEAMSLCVIGLWILAIASVFNDSRLSLASLYGFIPAAILTAFWLWNGASSFWSLSVDATWTEFNRTGGYLAAFLIGLAMSKYQLIRQLGISLFLFVVAAAAVVALGPKVAPSVIDNPLNLARVSLPIGYSNGMGLLLAYSLPLALYMASAKNFAGVVRVLASVMAALLSVALFFTFSRGALIALIVGLAIYFAVSPVRFRSLFMLALLSPVLVIAQWSTLQPSLMNNFVDLQDKLEPAASLRFFLTLFFIITAAVYAIYLQLEKKLIVPAETVRRVVLAILILVATSALIIPAHFAFSKPSISEWLVEKHEELSTPNPGGQGAERLLSMSLNGRWQLWREATANWEHQPIIGSGAQSFYLVHLNLREAGTSTVKQPHGLPFRLLTELGIVGFLLGLSFIVSVLVFSTRLLFKIGNRGERALVAALLSMNIIYLVHTSFDWDWNQFALTMPYFLFSGMLVGLYSWIGLEKNQA